MIIRSLLAHTLMAVKSSEEKHFPRQQSEIYIFLFSKMCAEPMQSNVSTDLKYRSLQYKNGKTIYLMESDAVKNNLFLFQVKCHCYNCR